MSFRINQSLLSRRQFAVFAAASAAGLNALAKTEFPVGLQQTAVGRNIQQDLHGTLRAVAKMGYDVIEFSAGSFMNWSPDQAREVRALLDEINLKCRSTHNEIVSFTGDGLSKSIELNQILGSRTLVSVRGPGPTPGGGAARGGTPATPPTLDAWKRFSEQLSQAAGRIRSAKMTLGFHNHGIEFQPVEGTRPIDILAANQDITSFHLNIGLCLQAGGDPIAFIQQCPGRIQSLLIQDYKGQARWKEIFSAAEGKGGLQFYLIQRTDGLFLVQREGNDLLDFAQQDLQYFRRLHG
ncbi:MAG TPA: sugar phosphate isomerase/epimerase [Bryobacteraceae bacterium]|jgi:sugar phosphate isomerase/epimerase|nr:sugar phosphate isomerase/epimerase [Bryobacteraceae bacterium]